MTMITPSYLGETIEYSSLHACRSTLEDPTVMQQLANLSQAVDRPGMKAEQKLEARYALAAFIAANPNGIYFNDTLWRGMQHYALRADTDSRLTGADLEGRRMPDKEVLGLLE